MCSFFLQFMMLMIMRSTLSAEAKVALPPTVLNRDVLQNIANFTFGPKAVQIFTEEEWNAKVKQLPQSFDGMEIIPYQEIRFEEILKALKKNKIANLKLYF